MLQKAKGLGNEPGTRATNPGGAPRLAEVLTRETRCNEVNAAAEAAKISHVIVLLDPREADVENGACRRIDLTKEPGLMAGSRESQLDTTDSGKQTRCG